MCSESFMVMSQGPLLLTAGQFGTKRVVIECLVRSGQAVGLHTAVYLVAFWVNQPVFVTVQYGVFVERNKNQFHTSKYILTLLLL